RLVRDVADKSLLPREADYGRQKGLADAVRHVHLLRLAPFGDDVAVVDDDAVERRAHAVRTENRIEWLVGRETLLMNCGLGVRRGGIARDRELDRLVQLCRVESFLLRGGVLPVETIRVVRSILGCGGRRDDERGDAGKREVFRHEEGFYRDSGLRVRDSTHTPTAATNPRS